VSDGSSNLGVIREHNDELEDTFNRQKRERQRLSEDMEGYRMEYEVEEFHSEEKVESEIEIEMAESMADPSEPADDKRSVRFAIDSAGSGFKAGLTEGALR
jgi:hypothetical protein